MYNQTNNKKLQATSYKLQAKNGFGLIEILVASAILSASLVTLTASSQIAFRLMKESLERTQAGFLVEEGVEVTRILRDDAWSLNIAPVPTGVEMYFVFASSTNTWTLESAAPPLIENLFTRRVVFDDVYRRDSDGEIIDEGSLDPKTLDPDTRKATIEVLWGDGRNVTFETYIANIFQN
ncbi:MAG: prepilin-type N-terminal cleavage/methylation domain-containing protein [Parcubacteria group bacterium]|nr:prepilin-type N-terminal cleavage/methylation domain-containing protein [Parcubacteria group bacterium]